MSARCRNVSKSSRVTIPRGRGAGWQSLACGRQPLAKEHPVAVTGVTGGAKSGVIVPVMLHSPHIYVFKRVLFDEYKIGISTDVAHRMKAVGIQMATRLELVLEFPGTRRDEAALHRQFDDERLYGEWFAGSPRLLAWIERQRSVQE